MHKKILFVLKKRGSYGVSYGLVNSCKFVADALKPYGIESKIVQVEDNNKIDREVNLFKPTHCFVEALWVVPSKFEVLLPLHKKVQWYVRLHSQTPFLGYEGIAFQWIKEYAELSKKYKNFQISANSAILVRDVAAALGITMPYSPNIYLFDKKNYSFLWQDNVVDIGCFGAIRPFKNHLNQALAALQFARENKLKLRFHINASRFENMGESILKNLRYMFKDSGHELVEHDWANHEDFIKLVRKMDLGLQVSYTETFNIVGADFVSNHIPLVGSKEIEWLHPWYQADPNDVADIVKKLNIAYYAKVLHLHRLNEMELKAYNKRAIEEWLDLLK
jgi:hypothetical protein